ncbi:antibiotic biosynthesis monooxygenase [uncultured Chryseobacterium sp.]|uniref:antibiotic biosynthesis monooxygenase n=1 Tax=uncultured Chryseobacterium sp. TaxID=259322 RepID=UPI0025CC8159|nr:antibiotic biosynthesis monooxygenase [uncultured Chryseobacterium sp.]
MKKYYVMVRFEIQKHDFETLYSLIRIFFEQEVSVYPGFISSRILTNEDHTIVINEAAWESKEKFDAFVHEIVSTSETSKKIQAFKPSRETFYEFAYLPKAKFS